MVMLMGQHELGGGGCDTLRSPLFPFGGAGLTFFDGVSGS